ncbi:hypothetical protein ACWXVT_02150 [Mycoplasma sp. 1573]
MNKENESTKEELVLEKVYFNFKNKQYLIDLVKVKSEDKNKIGVLCQVNGDTISELNYFSFRNKLNYEFIKRLILKHK